MFWFWCGVAILIISQWNEYSFNGGCIIGIIMIIAGAISVSHKQEEENKTSSNTKTKQVNSEKYVSNTKNLPGQEKKDTERPGSSTVLPQFSAEIYENDLKFELADDGEEAEELKRLEYELNTKLRGNPNSKKVRMVLLTASGKHSGACVAGYDVDKKEFIRFVSKAENGEAIPFHYVNDFKPYDIIEAEVLRSCPLRLQTENILVNLYNLRKVGRYNGSIVNIGAEIHYQDQQSILDTTDNHLMSVAGFRHSLEIVSVSNLVLRKVKKAYSNDYATYADFQYNGKLYKDYRVTDFNYDLRNRAENRIVIPYAALVLSLPYTSYIAPNGANKGYYKFIAAIYKTDNTGNVNKPNMCVTVRPNIDGWSQSEIDQLLQEIEKIPDKSHINVAPIAIKHHRGSDEIRSALTRLGYSVNR